jgi:hypothetical protein
MGETMPKYVVGAIQVWSPNDVKKFENFFPENDPFSVIFNEESKKRSPEA